MSQLRGKWPSSAAASRQESPRSLHTAYLGSIDLMTIVVPAHPSDRIGVVQSSRIIFAYLRYNIEFNFTASGYYLISACPEPKMPRP
jgi:hypothetical protein